MHISDVSSTLTYLFVIDLKLKNKHHDFIKEDGRFYLFAECSQTKCSRSQLFKYGSLVIGLALQNMTLVVSFAWAGLQGQVSDN